MRSGLAITASILILTSCGGSSSDDAVEAPPPEATLADPALEQMAATFAATAFAPTGGIPALPNLVPTRTTAALPRPSARRGRLTAPARSFKAWASTAAVARAATSRAKVGRSRHAVCRSASTKPPATDPIFRLVDGSNSPKADVSTVDARRIAYSMLLNKALIRVGIGIPDGAEFELAAVDDPYGFASAKELSLFRRPLPTANMDFLSTVMWDGRETILDPAGVDCVLGTTNCFATLHFTLGNQSNSATVGHSEAPLPISDAQRKAIVDFQTDLFTAQIFDRRGRLLDVAERARRCGRACRARCFTSALMTRWSVTIERRRRSRRLR